MLVLRGCVADGPYEGTVQSEYELRMFKEGLGSDGANQQRGWRKGWEKEREKGRRGERGDLSQKDEQPKEFAGDGSVEGKKGEEKNQREGPEKNHSLAHIHPPVHIQVQIHPFVG